MKIIPTSLDDVLVIEPKRFGDSRGFFTETYHQARYRDAGIHHDFVQDNLSFSVKNTLRGLHFQIRHPQAKLVQVLAGEVFDVVVDLRHGTPTYGNWDGFYLSAENMRQLFVPKGFAHGFCVVSDNALFSYKCSDFYVPEDEGGVLWSDPDIGIAWPVEDPIISGKDERYPLLRDLSIGQLPQAGR